mmetsp:Transcript_28514/g.48525  ORF Transcript_28514/g.48525 Transcript_28514/m.48525 type:complete len:407 (-) Transcript_28514:394-1614(-)
MVSAGRTHEADTMSTAPENYRKKQKEYEVPGAVSVSSNSSESGSIESGSIESDSIDSDSSKSESLGWKTVDLSYCTTSSKDPSLNALHDCHILNESSSSPVTGRLSNILEDYMVFPGALGKGHYGCVRECIHRATWQTYACKSIEKCKIGRLDHLQNEIRLLSEMDHDGIIKMVDCYEDADYLHIITEKCTGGELFDKIVDNKTGTGICLSEHRAACIIKSVLDAVAYLHENDIVHRDIKPENILFESAENDKGIKLVDFGLSRKHKRGAKPSMCNPVGTSYYMSPELIKGKYDKSCDLWAVGTITFILLCGYPPFNGNCDVEILQAINKGCVEFPAHHWASKTREAKSFIECLLQRDPRVRSTAQEALGHPWIINLGIKNKKRREKTRVLMKKGGMKQIQYLKIP